MQLIDQKSIETTMDQQKSAPFKYYPIEIIPAITGKCPYCKQELILTLQDIAIHSALFCHWCKQRIEI